MRNRKYFKSLFLEVALNAQEKAKESHIRLYRRLWISRRDLTEAQDILDTILALNLPLPRRDPPSPLLNALTIGIVISYSRPFIDSRGCSVVAERKLPGILLRTLSPKQRGIHDSIIQVRNKEIAHSDAEILELSLHLFPGGDSCICRETRAPFRRQELRVIRKIIDKILDEIERECEKIRQVLPHFVDL